MSSPTAALVLAPHPDDEVLGCLSFMLDEKDQRPLSLVFVTSGEGEGDPVQREREATEVSARLGLGAPTFWRLPDGGLAADRDQLASLLTQAMTDLNPAIVLTTAPDDATPDHAALGAVAREVCGNQTELLFYRSTHDISPASAARTYPWRPLRRARALAAYRSQWKLLLWRVLLVDLLRAVVHRQRPVESLVASSTYNVNTPSPNNLLSIRSLPKLVRRRPGGA